MKAIVVSEFGDAEVLRLDESVDTPSIASDEILIQTTFSPINYTDIHGRNGKNKAVKTPYVPGTEAVGEIIEVGADVSGFEVGQRVASYTSGGSYAEITKAKAILSYAIPEGLEDRDACCLTSGITAYNLIKKVAGVNSDDTVLIHSAAGGAGILATQIARVSGAKKSDRHCRERLEKRTCPCIRRRCCLQLL